MTRRASWLALAAALMPACSETQPTTTPSPARAVLPAAPPSPAFLPGCATSPTELPASPLYDPEDPRLRDTAVLVAHKSARRLMLFDEGSLRGCWAMGLGFDPRGHKQHEGDGRTPEGWYRTSDKPWCVFRSIWAAGPADLGKRSDAPGQRERSDQRERVG